MGKAVNAIRRAYSLPQEVATETVADKASSSYDLSLWKHPNGDYELVLFMKLQFYFESGDGGNWTKAEKQNFISDWQIAVKNAWGGRHLKRLKSGHKVSLELRFEVQQGGWMADHWELTVVKIKPGGFRVSSVTGWSDNVELDSGDLTHRSKGSQLQRGAVHEFGHMLDLDDEYENLWSRLGDEASIMVHGEQVRTRHLTTPRMWLDRKCKELGIQ